MDVLHCAARLIAFVINSFAAVGAASAQVPERFLDFTFDLWGYTDAPQFAPQFDCQKAGTHRLGFAASGLEGTGTMMTARCSLRGFLTHRDLDLQVVDPEGGVKRSVLYRVNTTTGSIHGNELLRQTLILIDGSIPMSYGVSHAAPPIGDQAYVYLGHDRSDWMGRLVADATTAGATVGDLVLPGAHDAGMYVTNLLETEPFARELCKFAPGINELCRAAVAAGKVVPATILAQNLALTQKDSTTNQLKLGVRFFDFRPARDELRRVFHVHNFVPGAQFANFLREMDDFLAGVGKDEVVIVQITASGINRTFFTPLTKDEVGGFLESSISSAVGYDLVDSIVGYRDRTLKEVAAGGKRVIVVFGKTDVNDSYEPSLYTKSLTDPTHVLSALETATGRCRAANQYNVLQLQNTGSGALGSAKGEIANHLPAWTNDLIFSRSGSILQATKPTFDHATYSWLASPNGLRSRLTACAQPIVLLNDFVDPALVSHAVALTEFRARKRTAQ